MDQLRAELEPLLELIRHHVPPVYQQNALGGAALLAVFGLILALWGVRVYRAGLVVAFAGVGAWVGLAADQWLGMGRWFCLISSTLVFGALGFVLYRLWVGIGWAALLSLVAVSVLGVQQAWPQWSGFSESHLSGAAFAEAQFEVPSPAEQARFNSPDPATVLKEFGSYLGQQVPGLKRNAGILAALAGVVGLLMGLLAVKLTVILASSLLGVLLLAASAGYCLSRFEPQALEQAVSQPAAVWLGMGAAILLAMAVQWLQTRAPKKEEAAASKTG
jgi:hypothetical protein